MIVARRLTCCTFACMKVYNAAVRLIVSVKEPATNCSPRVPLRTSRHRLAKAGFRAFWRTLLAEYAQKQHRSYISRNLALLLLNAGTGGLSTQGWPR